MKDTSNEILQYRPIAYPWR